VRCGLSGKNPREHFLRDLEAGSINYGKLLVHADGTTALKFQVIGAVHYLFDSLEIIIDDQRTVKFSFDYDAQLATRRKIVSLGLKKIKTLYVPITLLSSQGKNINLRGQPVLGIFRRNRVTGHCETIIQAKALVCKLPVESYFR